MVIMTGQNTHNGPLKEYSYSEKRHLPRWQVANRVIYLIEDEAVSYETTSRNLSCGGACFVTALPLPVSKKIKMKIFLSGGSVVLVDGQVVWSKSLPEEHLAGVIFTNTSFKAKELILEHAFEVKRTDVVNHWFQGWDQSKP